MRIAFLHERIEGSREAAQERIQYLSSMGYMLQLYSYSVQNDLAAEDIVPTRYASLETGQIRAYTSGIRAGLCAE